jgi:predicted lipoprotein with Yx(FWY)xxD motif
MDNAQTTRLPFHRIATTHIVVTVLLAGGLATALGVMGASGAAHHHVKGVVVSSFKSAKDGTVLSDGKTLYTLKPNATKCAATCHKFWIEVLLPKGATKAAAGAGVSAAKLGTVKVAGGLQVTYGGKPLYWFFLDKSAGQVKGNVTDTWGKWAAVVLVKPASTPTATTQPPTTPTTTKATPPTTTTTKAAPTTTTTAPAGGGVGFSAAWGWRPT